MLSPPQLGDGAPGWWDTPAKKARSRPSTRKPTPPSAARCGAQVQQTVYDEVPFIEVGKFNGLSARSAKLEGYTPAIWPFFWNTGLAK